eukprot:COSAG03_NODE_369_length_8525_cov_21.686565_5_plen_90_part_00
MAVLPNGVVVRDPAGRSKSTIGVTPYSRTVRRATRRLLHGAPVSITFEELEARYLELVRLLRCKHRHRSVFMVLTGPRYERVLGTARSS